MLVIGLTAALFWFRRKNQAVVDGCVIRVWQDSHANAIVLYRNRSKIVRFGAEVGVFAGGGEALAIDAPETMYTDAGEVIGTEEYKVIRERVSRGLQQLGIEHKWDSPDAAAVPHRDVND